MPGIVHFLIGAVIIQNFNINAAVFLIIASHFIADLIPHLDYKINNIRQKNWNKAWKEMFFVSIDVFAAIFIVIILADNPILALIGGFIGIFPDILDLFHYMIPKSRILKAIWYFHSPIIHYFDRKKIPNIIRLLNQIIVFGIAIFLL